MLITSARFVIPLNTWVFIHWLYSLLTGRLFCDVVGGGWGGGVGSWASSFLLSTSQKSVRMTGTPHRYCSCRVTSGMDSFRLHVAKKRRRTEDMTHQGSRPRQSGPFLPWKFAVFHSERRSIIVSDPRGAKKILLELNKYYSPQHAVLPPQILHPSKCTWTWIWHCPLLSSLGLIGHSCLFWLVWC